MLLQGKRRVGRPIAYLGDPDAPHLTPAERRRMKRRVANRESARRVRARQFLQVSAMADKVMILSSYHDKMTGKCSACKASGS